ncbi:unnamed protein product, partial [Didymodactylos carnosus]
MEDEQSLTKTFSSECTTNVDIQPRHKIPETRNFEPYLVIWCQSNVSSIQNTCCIQLELRRTINFIKTFDNIDECQQHIETIRGDKIILIISQHYVEALLSQILDLKQLIAVYIYDENEQNDNRNKPCQMIKGILSNSNNLIKQISDDLVKLQKTDDREMPMTIFDQTAT